MAAQWRLLTDFLSTAPDHVKLSWAEFDAIVGGVPNSATDHYPQWWHGSGRPNVRAWQAAGFEPADIKPGVSVLFVRSKERQVDQATATPGPMQHSGGTPTGAPSPPAALEALSADDCLIIIPCSAAKNQGGSHGLPTLADSGLEAARRSVLGQADSSTDESRVMPAVKRYSGHLYQEARSDVLANIAADGRLVIISGGYGVLDGRDQIGCYNRILAPKDWPRGLLERVLAQRASSPYMNVVAFAGTSTPYAALLRKTPWRLAPGRTAHLVTMRGLRGVSTVSRSLGTALRAFVTGSGDYPAATAVETLA